MRAVVTVVDDHPVGIPVLGPPPRRQLRLGRVGVIRDRRRRVVVVDAPRGALIRNDMHFVHGLPPADELVATARSPAARLPSLQDLLPPARGRTPSATPTRAPARVAALPTRGFRPR